MKLLKLSIVPLIILLSSISGFSQNTAISDVPHTPNASSVLDAYSTSKGMLIPRMTQAQRIAIATPATGLLVYQTNATAGFYYYNGTVWVPFMTGTASTVAWIPGGNPVASLQNLGTTSNYDLPIITNGTEKVRITTSGAVGIGSTAFNVANPEKLLLECGITTSSTMARFKGSIDSHLKLNIQNASDGVSASTDFVATADNGTDSTNYVNVGINSSNYATAANNFGGNNDAYLYSNSRNLLVGTASANSDILFLVSGGSLTNNCAMRVDGATRNIIVGRRDGTTTPSGNTLRGPNAGGTNINGGDLTIQGGRGSGTGTGGNLIINGGGSISGNYGPVNINANFNSAVNIGTGTTTKDVTIGNSNNNVLFPKLSAVGSIHYTANASGQLAANSLLTWDAATNRMGINTAAPAAGLDVNTNFKLGAAGSNLTNIIKTNVSVTNTATFNYTAIKVITVTVTGANLNAAVIAHPRITLPIGIGIAYAYVSAANTVTIVFTNTDATARAIGTGVVFDVTVIN
ncbi:MAG: hypothetical protein ABI723_19320 [Bacteroidia bacterium]